MEYSSFTILLIPEILRLLSILIPELVEGYHQQYLQLQLTLIGPTK